MTLIREFINEIRIHHAQRKDGRITQKIDIYYNCVGMIPQGQESLSSRKVVEVETRRGVALCHVPS
ncbi:MAG: DUF4368 domain-containing protein [Coriobacteriia bacterium]|nr:DUF4368 domain-containing protein [Coriobacteriia bacterium]